MISGRALVTAPLGLDESNWSGTDIASSQVAELLEIAPTNHVTSATRLGEGAGGDINIRNVV